MEMLRFRLQEIWRSTPDNGLGIDVPLFCRNVIGGDATFEGAVMIAYPLWAQATCGLLSETGSTGLNTQGVGR